MQKALKPKQIFARTMLYVVVSLICIFILYPYFVMVCTSLKSRSEIFAMDSTVLPKVALWQNFLEIWKRAPMGTYMLNSILIASGSSLIAMVCGIPAAYALARMKFKGQTAFLGFIIVSQMFAPVVLLIGIYKVMSTLHMSNSIIGLLHQRRLQPGLHHLAAPRHLHVHLRGDGAGCQDRRLQPSAVHVQGAAAHGSSRHRDHPDLHFHQRME